MIVIKENISEKIPGITSLFVDANTFYNKEIFNTLIQIQDSFYIKNLNLIEFSINQLYFLIDYLTNFDDVKFIKYKDYKKECVEIDDLSRFKVRPFNHQIDAINYGLSKDSWLLLDDCGLGKTLTIIYLAEELK